MTKICPNCQTENEDNSDFCQECGKQLPKTVKIAENGSSPKKGFRGWWDKQSNGIKAITGVGACCFGVILFLVVMAVLFPMTSLTLENSSVEIDNQTTQYLLKGNTEANAMVQISSKALNINNTEVPVGNNGNFEYQLQIPKDVKEVEVTVTAKSPNKSQNTANVKVTRPSPTADKTTQNTDDDNVFENKYYKFTLPPGTTVRDLDGNLAPEGGNNENLQLWDSSVNSKDIDGKERGYAEIGTGRMDGNDQNSLISLGYTPSKTIAGYKSYYVFTPASGIQEAFGEYMIILGESKVQPGRTDTLSIEFDYDTEDKIKIVTDSLVIKSSAIK